MRDFRDAKLMAHALRDALKNRAVEITHSECLELIATVFGYHNWNVLSAKIEAAGPANAGRSPSVRVENDQTLYCSFCGKSQHKVRKLIAGPTVFICDECIELCNDFVDDLHDEEELARLLESGAENASSMSIEDLARYVERGRRGAERNRLTLRAIQQGLAMADDQSTPTGDILALPRFLYLRNKRRDELLVLQQIARTQLSRYEEALRLARTALGARRP